VLLSDCLIGFRVNLALRHLRLFYLKPQIGRTIGLCKPKPHNRQRSASEKAEILEQTEESSHTYLYKVIIIKVQMRLNIE